MFWNRKKLRVATLDEAFLARYVAQRPQSKLPLIPKHGLVLRCPIAGELARRQFDFDEVWNQLPADKCWNIVARRRLRDLCKCDEIAEFERYIQLKHRSDKRFGPEIFVGIDPDTNHPIFVPRRIFRHHSYILGKPGQGKTSQALATILLQLAESYIGERGTIEDAPPIMIIDLKEGGDGYLRSLAEHIARKRNQKLRFFSLDPDYESMQFDPLRSLGTIQYPLKLVETLLNALSLVYPQGYGADFFTNEQRVQLMDIICARRLNSLSELITQVRSATRGKSANKDARGLYGALAALQHAVNIRSNNEHIRDSEQLIDFERFFEDGEVMYVHLDSRSLGPLSRDIGKLMLFAMLETASFRKKHRRPRRQAFVVIDEFHRLAALNVVQTLEDSRSAGVGFIFCHQSPQSMPSRDADLYGMISSLCSFQQFLSLEDERVIEQVRLVSGRISEWLNSDGISTSTGTMSSSGSAFGNSWASTRQETNDPRGGFFMGPITSTGTTSSSGSQHTSSTARSEGEMKSVGRNEQKISALTPELITRIRNTPQLSLTLIDGAGPDCLTPTGGLPTLVQGLFPFTETAAENMEKTQWPTRPKRAEEDYYGRARPDVPRAAIQGLSSRQGARKPLSRPELPPPQSKRSQTQNPIEKRLLQKRIRDFAERFANEMLREAITVVQFARANRVKVRFALQIASRLGIEVRHQNDKLTSSQARALKDAIDGTGTQPS